MRGIAWWHENGVWKREIPASYFQCDDVRVISLVGGGGKSSLMDHLASTFQAQGHKTVAMTTTRIARTETCDTWAECCDVWVHGHYAVCGRPAADEKLMEPAPALLRLLLERADRILIEADGSKKKPCKVPADHEPVLLRECDTVIGVMGLDALGQPVGECGFRTEQLCALLGCDLNHCLTEEDAVRILLSPRGTKKSVGERKYIIALNKCDNMERLERGKRMIDLLEKQGHFNTVLTCFL